MLRVVDHADYQGCLPHTDRAESFLSDLGQIVSLTNSPEAKFFATLYADGEVSDHSIPLHCFMWRRDPFAIFELVSMVGDSLKVVRTFSPLI